MKIIGLVDYSKSIIRIISPVVALAFALAVTLIVAAVSISTVQAQSALPIADAHLHYSHDSVEMTPPERVIELMREANLKFALVSSSDDTGTQRLSELAPDLIVPGLRPYRRRGELRTWFTDQGALDYVEALLAKNKYASLGEFHLYGKDVDLPIPRRIVELAVEYNLILHAHSDTDAVERLLAQSDTVKVIWAHSGFAEPEAIAQMLSKHDRLWADLAFRADVGSGGSLSDAWRKLFELHPDRIMLGTDTYTPERMYYIPEHAAAARVWLSTLPDELAENIAWKNAFELIMPVWQKNKALSGQNASMLDQQCVGDDNALLLEGERYSASVQPDTDLKVSEIVSLKVMLCGKIADIKDFKLDASMPVHGHGTNYTPTITQISSSDAFAEYRIEGLVLHMPGQWQWDMVVVDSQGRNRLKKDFMLR